jgi:hypothetical protein
MQRVYLLLILLTSLIVGCYEVQRHYVLNPDGSGKVHIEAKLSSLMGDDPGKAAKEAVKGILKDTKGVEVWSDVDFAALEDGRVHFKGTAYFKDVSQIKLQNLDDFRVSLNHESGGGLVLRVDQDQPGGKKEKPRQSTLQEQRSRYQQMKPMLAAMLATMKSELTFQFPGTMVYAVNLKPQGSYYGLRFDGTTMITAVDALMQNDEWLQHRIQQNLDIQDDSPLGEELNELLFGQKGPIEARLGGPFQDMFNYSSEVDKAKAGYEAMLERIGLADLVPPKMATGGGFRSLRVVKVMLNNMEDPDYMVFGTDRVYQVSLLGELPGAVLNVKEGTLERAVADNGSDLMPESDWERQIYASLSARKTHVLMDVKLKIPGPDVNGIREIAGHLQYEVSQKTRVYRSPLVDFVTNAQLGFLNSNLSRLLPSSWDGDGHEVYLQIGTIAESIKAIRLLDASDTPIETNMFSASNAGTEKRCEAYFTVNKPLPKRGYVEVELYDDVQRFVIPFQIGNIDILGNLTR